MDNWKSGKAKLRNGKTVFWSAKVYDESSGHGIENGRISKLLIKDSDGQVLANYDRGWDVKPVAEIQGLYRQIVKKHNKPKGLKRNKLKVKLPKQGFLSKKSRFF